MVINKRLTKKFLPKKTVEKVVPIGMIGKEPLILPNYSGVKKYITEHAIAPAAHAPSHRAVGADPVDHDQLLNYVAAEHIDWTGATEDHSTSGDYMPPALSDFRVVLPDAAGAQRFRVMDSGLNSVFLVDSDGVITTYNTIGFNISGGSIAQLPASLVITGGAADSDSIVIFPSSSGTDSLTLTEAAGMTYISDVTITSACTWTFSALTTGTCHDTIATAGTTGTGYKITLDSDNANNFSAIQVVSGASSTIVVHNVDEQGLITNLTATGLSRWKRRVWKGCTEMETANSSPFLVKAWPFAGHYKQLSASDTAIYWTMQVPHDWDGSTDLLCTIRIVVDQAGGVAAADTFDWNVSMSCSQAGDLMGANGQGANGFYNPGVSAQWTIHEISWNLDHDSAPGTLQAGDHVAFNFYGTLFAGIDHWDSVGIIGAWVEYKSVNPELPNGTT